MKNKTKTYKYFIILEGNQILVCKKDPMALFQIIKKIIEILQNKIKVSSVTITPDKRGRHNIKPHKMPDEIKNL